MGSLQMVQLINYLLFKLCDWPLKSRGTVFAPVLDKYKFFSRSSTNTSSCMNMCIYMYSHKFEISSESLIE